MDGIESIESPEYILKTSLEMCYAEVVKMSKIMAKDAALHKIRLQPFFGDYWSGKKCSDTIKIRRPVSYMKE